MIHIFMQITFNTNDSIEELKKIYEILQETITNKGGLPQSQLNIGINPNMRQVSVSPVQQQIQQPQSRVSVPSSCRVIPYQDMSEKLSEILSNMSTR